MRNSRTWISGCLYYLTNLREALNRQLKPKQENNYIKFSVAITTYNHEKFLAKSLDSVLQQKHKYPYEIVISDDCSTDGTVAIIQSYHEKYPHIIRPLFHAKNAGVAKNSLHNLYACQGEYIATLDGDDYWTDPDKIKRQISFLDRHPDFVLSCHRYKKLQNSNEFSDDPNEALFKKKRKGFEFGRELYFEHWITQTLTVVFRKSALKHNSILDTFRYCWDTEIFWMLLENGKGYIHNFFGGIYRIHSQGVWSGSDDLRKNSIMYLIAEELLTHEPKNPFLKELFKFYRNKLRDNPIKTENSKVLNLAGIDNKNFTIICDDGWGEEVYKSLNLQALSPFIGIRIYNADFVELASNLHHYLAEPLRFIKPAEAKYPLILTNAEETEYPIALAGENVELHFIGYNSEYEALQKWTEGIQRINWSNLFLKMDASRESGNIDQIVAFNNIRQPYINKVCFVSSFHKKEIPESLKDTVIFVDYWNPESNIFFPYSILSFNVIDWLNSGNGNYTISRPFSNTIFSADQENKQYYLLRYDSHYFERFDDSSIHLLDSYFPDSITVSYDAAREVAIVDYDKSGLDHFRLSVREETHPTYLELFIDLKNKNDRHAFILARGAKHHKLRIDFVPWHKIADHDGTHLNVQGLEQEIPEDFEWMHFDLSVASERGLERLFEQIKSFCFYINPDERAKGTIEIVAIFVGSVERFEEMIANQSL